MLLTLIASCLVFVALITIGSFTSHTNLFFVLIIVTRYLQNYFK